MLDNGSYITIDRISDRLKVSRSTIVNDLEEIRLQLDRMQIKLETKTNKGLRVSEKESRIRNLLTDMLIQKSWSSTPVFYQMLLDLFDPSCSWPEIREFVRAFHKKRRKELDQDTLQTICSCFFTVLNRSCKGAHPSLTEVLDAEMFDGPQWIVQLGESLFSAFGLELSNNERRYFLSYLQKHIAQPKAASEEIVNIQVMTCLLYTSRCV